MRRSWVEISRRKLAENVRAIRARIPASTEICAVVKANAYGHGVGLVAPALLEAGVEGYAVASLEEAVELRRWIHSAPILVLGGCPPDETEAFRKYRLTAAHFRLETPPKDIPFEVKIDTGMTRLGIPWTEAAQFLASCSPQPAGVFSHFASPETDPGFSNLQLKRFLEATRGSTTPHHIASSAGLRVAGAFLDRVRVGLALYGIRATPEIDYLQPVLTWKTSVLALQEVPAGRAVGYGGIYQTHRPSRLAVLSVGYADGYSRALSKRGKVRIRGALAPMAGRVSMDLATVDVTDIPGVRVGDHATLLEADERSPLSANQLARLLDTISYEVLTAIGARVDRVGV